MGICLLNLAKSNIKIVNVDIKDREERCQELTLHGKVKEV